MYICIYKYIYMYIYTCMNVISGVLDSHFDRSEGRRLQIAAKGDNTMYICSYTSISLCTYAYMNIYMYTYACMNGILGCWSLILIGVKAEDCKSLPKVTAQCISLAIHLYLYVQMHIYIYIYIYVHVCMYACYIGLLESRFDRSEGRRLQIAA